MEPDVKYTLKMLRAKENLSQKQVADALGVSLTTYNAWEKDISNVAVSKVAAVADFYGVTLGQISFCPVHENNSCTN